MTCIFISENLNISTISDVDSNENSNILAINSDIEFSDLIEGIDYSNEELLNAQNTFSNWIVYNQSHLPGFIINKYKEPVIANINRLNLIIESFLGYFKGLSE